MELQSHFSSFNRRLELNISRIFDIDDERSKSVVMPVKRGGKDLANAERGVLRPQVHCESMSRVNSLDVSVHFEAGLGLRLDSP